jgi:hypothetical protein
MLMSTTADDAPMIPYFPELIFGLGSLLVLAALIFLVVKLVRSRGRSEGQVGVSTSELTRQGESASDIKSAP